jgi:anti-sigma factor RsiW
MNISCNDRERIFLDGSVEEWAALEAHSAHCAVCAEEVRAWKAISQAVEELRDYRQDATLWHKIESSLREHQPTAAQRWWQKLGFRGGSVALGWRTALAGALVLLLALSGIYVARYRSRQDPTQGRLLKNSTLAEVERTERDYMKAIDALASQAKPELDSPTPLMASYQEKLIVLDSAIDELRIEAGRNPSNAHLRYELLAMYQEKQETLQEVLETKR